MVKLQSQVNRWLLIGFVWLGTVGPLWHFLFDWSGNSRLAGLIAPVNESVWEHLKMGYWALLLFSLPEFLSMKGLVKNYFPARLLGFTMMSGTILATFYSYSAFTGHSILWVDILSYFAGATVCQVIGQYMFRRSELPKWVQNVALFFWIFLAFGFAWLTIHPPEWPIFMDHRFGTFGMPR